MVLEFAIETEFIISAHTIGYPCAPSIHIKSNWSLNSSLLVNNNEFSCMNSILDLIFKYLFLTFKNFFIASEFLRL